MSQLKTTLIFPGIAGRGFNSLQQGMDAGWISHGLASLSAAAKAQGFAIDLIDLRALSSWEHFDEVLAERAPDVVALTMMSVDYEPTAEVVRRVKQHNPEMITVIGGPHVTLALEDAIRMENVDYLVTQEGEITFPKLLRAIESGSPPDRRVLRGEAPDLDALPFTDRDLFLNEWRKFGYSLTSPEVPFVRELPSPFVTLIAGRGCNYNCSFCKPGEDFIFGKRTRRRSPENVIREMIDLRERYDFNSFMFHDDCLTEDRPWVAEFVKLYRENGFTQPWFCQSRADIIALHEDVVAMMAGANLKGYFIGFESGNQRILNFLRKGTKVETNLDAARVCRKYGIKIWANYMLGIPTETNKEAMDTVRMIQEIDPDYYSPAFFTPHPGTDLYYYVVENDLSLIQDYASYRRNPTEPKIAGVDYDFLINAREESQRRLTKNVAKRWLKHQIHRFRPANVVRKLGFHTLSERLEPGIHARIEQDRQAAARNPGL